MEYKRRISHAQEKNTDLSGRSGSILRDSDLENEKEIHGNRRQESAK